MSVFEDRYKPNMEVKQIIPYDLCLSVNASCVVMFTQSSFSLPLVYAQLEEGKRLVRDAIAAGIFCDLGSGSNVDLCVITEKGVDYLRGYDQPVQKGQK